jgi:flavin reductase (DIM6/NTAB) family NADH-FMN oxidoreductase RutF
VLISKASTSTDPTGSLTGRNPVPATKPSGCRYEPDKFAAAGLTPEPSRQVRPPRLAECPLQLEAQAVRVRPDSTDSFVVIEAAVRKVHADPSSYPAPTTSTPQPGPPSSTTSATTSAWAPNWVTPTEPEPLPRDTAPL